MIVDMYTDSQMQIGLDLCLIGSQQLGMLQSYGKIWPLGVAKNVIERSSVDARYRTVANGVCELVWIRRRITRELKLKFEDPVKLFCDNKSAISNVRNPIHHDRTKHVEVDRHFIKDKIEEGTLSVEYVISSHQLVDLFTKGLS